MFPSPVIVQDSSRILALQPPPHVLDFICPQAIIQQQLPQLTHFHYLLQGKNAEKEIDVLVKTLPKGKRDFIDSENTTAVATQAGLGFSLGGCSCDVFSIIESTHCSWPGLHGYGALLKVYSSLSSLRI